MNSEPHNKKLSVPADLGIQRDEVQRIGQRSEMVKISAVLAVLITALFIGDAEGQSQRRRDREPQQSQPTTPQPAQPAPQQSQPTTLQPAQPAPQQSQPTTPQQTQPAPQQTQPSAPQQALPAPQQNPALAPAEPLPLQKTDAERADEARERQEKADLNRRLTQLSADLAGYSAYLYSAALTVAAATICLFFATAVLAIYGFFQSRAWKIATTAAIDHLNLSREALISANHAFLFCKDVHAVASMKSATDTVQEWTFYPVWENGSATPPRLLFMASSWSVFTPDIPESFDFPYLGETPVQRAMVGPHATALGAESVIPVAKLLEVKKGGCKIYIWGWVEYDDVFAGTHRHRTEYCMEVRVIGNPETQDSQGPIPFAYSRYPKHNGHNEECMKPLTTAAMPTPGIKPRATFELRRRSIGTQ
jgi:hypothetical protein